MNVMVKLGIFSIRHKCRSVNTGFNIHVSASVTLFTTTVLQCGCKFSALEFWDLIHVVATGPVNLQRTPFGCEMRRLLQENLNSNHECVGGPLNEWTWIQVVHLELS